MPGRMPPRRLALLLTSTLLITALAGIVWSPLLWRLERGRDLTRAREETAARDASTHVGSQAQAARLGEAYGRLPLSFEANEGQTDPRVKFISRGSGYTLFLTPSEAVIRTRIAVLRMSLVGADAHAPVAGLEEQPGRSNYLIGRDPSKWRTNVSNYSRVRYAQIYPGVELEYYGNHRQLEYDFRVAPGANPKQIGFAFKGAESLHVERESGDLVLETAGGQLRQRKPVVYQETNGARRELEGRYVLRGNGEVGFDVAGYDKSLPLVIDPVLSYSTLLGGTSSGSEAFAVAVDSFGDAYVTGDTTSSSFPTTTGALDTAISGAKDAFVTKLNATGTALIYSTYIGGNGNNDQGKGIAVDQNGNAYAVGVTDSTDFPTVNQFKTDQPGNDGFLAKLNPTGTALLYSTYIGGSGVDAASGVAVDAAGNAYVTGNTQSSDFLTGPAPATTLDTTLGGTQDAFVVKVNTRASGAASFAYGTFLGGSLNENGKSIALSRTGEIFVGGDTTSGDFPVFNAFQGALGGAQGGFVTKLNAAGSAIVFSTYLGGSSSDGTEGIAVDFAGNAYALSTVVSTDFPTTVGAAQTSYGGGGSDAAVTKFSPSGGVTYSTFIGGSNLEIPENSIEVDSHGNAVVAGFTLSANFPVVNAFQSTQPGGGGDIFVTKLNSTGSQFIYSTYLGGATSFDDAKGLALDAFGNAYVVGNTSSSDYPTTTGAFDTTATGSDAIVTKLSQLGSCSTASYSASSGSPFSAGNDPRAVAIGDFDGDGKQDLAIADAGTNTVSVLLGDGTGNFGTATSFNVGTAPLAVAVGDFNNDGKQDIATANRNANTVSVLLGDGAGGFAAATSFNVGTSPDAIAVADFDKDGKQDIVTGNGDNHISVLLGDGAGNFAAATSFNVGDAVNAVAVGDFNLDGNLDIVTANTGGTASLLLSDGGGNFGAATSFNVGTLPLSVAVGDFNGDGKQDIVTANRGSDNVSVLLGDGAGGFGAATSFATDSGPVSVAVADFNGDGKPDLVTADLFAGNVSLLAGDGTGSFSAATNVTAGSSPQFVAVGDFDGDGKPDLAVPNNTSNNVAVLLDSCGSTTSNTIVVTNTNDSGAGSLRQAILDSNSTPGTKETITFNIPGAGVHTISPTSALPTITEPVVIDGYTQPGASQNTLATGDNAVIEIELDGTSAGSTTSGLVITGGSSTVRGLAINRFGSGAGPGGTGIELNGNGGNTVEGCFIGTNAAGTSALANNFDAISIGGTNNIVGGSALGARNLLSGNGRSGVLDNGGGTGNNKIQNNLIGTDASGATAIANGQGVIIFGTSGDTVGGAGAGQGNVISGNGLDGVSIDKAINPADNNSVLGNLIGTKADGTSALGNGRHGVFLADASSNTVGGTTAAAANTIAFNGSVGVAVTGASTGDAIEGNSIHDNTSLGIDLGSDGVTANDSGDPDTGPNNLQNFPVLTSATSGAGSTNIQGTFNSLHNTTFRIEFFVTPTCSASGNGEGKALLGSASVTTDDSGNATINSTFGITVVNGQVMTATATDPSGNTSEFSACTVISPPPPTWTGAFSGDWFTAANWNTNAVPTSTDTVVIPSTGVTNEPTISSSNAVASTVEVQSGRTLTIANNKTLTASTLTIDSGATLHTLFNQTGFVNASVTNNGTVDGVNANSLFDFLGTSFVNNGTVSVGFFRFGSTQTLSGTGSFTSGTVEIISGSTVTLASNHTLSTLSVSDGTFDQGASFNLTVGPLTVSSIGTFRNLGTGDLTLSGDVDNGGTIQLDGGGVACGDADSILIRSSVAGTQRSWTGGGTFSVADVDVKDQAGTASVNAQSSTDSGNNGANWHFVGCAANNIQWVSAVSGNWSDASKWQDGTGANRVPAAGDDVTINADGTYTVTLDVDAAVNTLTLGRATSTGTQTLDDPAHTLSLASSSSVLPTGVFSLGGGTRRGNGTLTVSGVFNWSGGNLQDAGVTAIASAGHLNVTGNSDKLISQQTLDNAGIITMTGAGRILGDQGAVIDNQSGGLFDIQTDTGFGFGSLGAFATFNNLAGATFKKSAGVGNSNISQFNFNNAGAFELFSGTVAIDQGYTQTAGSTVLEGGQISTGNTVALQGGSLTGTGTFTVGTLNNSGGTVAPGLAGAGCLTIGGNYTQGPSGTLNVEVGGPTQCAQFDRLSVTGAATLAGTLNASLVNSFSPTAGQSFQVMTFASHTGTFSTVNGPFTTSFSATDLNIIASGGAQTFVVTNTNDSGAGSLRQAMLDANASTNTTDTITFNIPGAGVHTISPASPLPTITDPLIIDGYTQPGASINTQANADNALILIELDGTNAGASVGGLNITGGSSTVRGLVINRFGGPGIELQTAGGNTVVGNFIGTNASGLAAVANGLDGIADFSANNIIGGTSAGARNVIAGNGRFGIFLNASASGAVIQGNFVGVGSDGATALGHPTQGILNNGSSNVTVGGTAAGAGNVIAHNQGGVFIHSGTGNAVLGNSIFANGSGIDLNDDGVTPNDLGDADTGANNLQNFPVLTSAVSNGVTTTIAGTLNSTANTTFRVEFFSNPACAASGNGEGQTFLGSTGVTTDGSGNVSVSATFNIGLPVGSVVTSTATDPAGNTSEFSACVPVVAPGTTFSISGHVADQTNNPLVGVNVHLGGSATGDVTTNPAGDYTFANLPQGGNFNLTPTEINFRFTPASTVVSNLQSNQTGIDFKGQSIDHTITGHIIDAQGNPLPGVTVTLAGSFSAVTHTDAQGNFSFPDIPENGSFVVTPEKEGFVFNPAHQSLTGVSSDTQFQSVGTVQPSPTPTPDQSDDFSGGPDPDPSKWVRGILTNPPPAFDPLVHVFLAGGLLHVQPRPDADGLHYNGLVSVRALDLNSTPIASVEVVQAATGGGAQTIFGLGRDSDNWFRFSVVDNPTPTPTPTPSPNASPTPLAKTGVTGGDTTTGQTLLFEINVGGQKFSVGIAYNPAQQRFWRFRHDAPAHQIIFETSPDAANWTERFRATLPADQTQLIAELSAGTFRPTQQPVEALFDNFLISPSPQLQFSNSDFSVVESAGAAQVQVIRTGSAESPDSVDFATSDGSARAGRDYTPVSGTLVFDIGERLKTISIPVINNNVADGNRTVNITLSNAVGGRLGSIPHAVLTILDDDRASNPIDDTTFFVTQQYLDFLGRAPDADGLAFWVRNIDSCGSDASCRAVKRVDTSAAFFLSIEFQETGYVVDRFYRATFGRAPTFDEYLPDLSVLRDGVIIGQTGAEDRLAANKQLFASQWVARPAFKQAYDRLNDAQYVDSLAANAGIKLAEQDRTALVVGLLTKRETRASVLLKIIENDSFAQGEFDPAFVRMQYFGYLRRDPDASGFQFWLAKLNHFGGDFRAAEMVRAFISSTEYRARFGQP